MPKTVCRIRWRPGSPLGLSIYPCVTFLDLPREIRDQVYYDALVATGPITVWSGSRDFSSGEISGRMVSTETYTVEPKDTVLDSLATGLFRCNTIVAHEALEIFYRCNIFCVTGFEIWNPMYKWLNNIGRRNRRQLRTMTADMPPPEQLGTDTYGTRTLCHFYSPFPRVHSVVNIDTEVWDTPHYLDPAIEAIFRLLGESGVRLSLELLLGRYLPGVVLWQDEQVEDAYRWGGMDIPNEIERVNGLYACRVDVLWRCWGQKSKHIEQRELIQKKGWKILDEKDGLFPVTPVTLFNPFANQTMPVPQTSIIRYSLTR
jgi:hypothetical protein